MKKHTGTVILLAMLVIIFTVPVYAAKINRKKVKNQRKYLEDKKIIPTNGTVLFV